MLPPPGERPGDIHVDVVLWRTGQSQNYWSLLCCPFCGMSHLHGAGEPHEDPRGYLGSRLSHCKHSKTRRLSGTYWLRWNGKEM